MEPCEGVDEEAWAPCEQADCKPHLLEVGVEVEKLAGGMKAEALSYDTQGWIS